MFTGLSISALGQTFEDGDGFEKSEWAENIEYTPKPKTQYTIGGVPKRSVPSQRFSVDVKLVFASNAAGESADFETFREFFYDSSIEYLTVVFSAPPLGRSSATMPMAFVNDLEIKQLMANSIEVIFNLVEVLYVFES